MRNFRFLDLLRFVWRFRREGFVFLRKLLFRKATFVHPEELEAPEGAAAGEPLAYIPEHHTSHR